MPPPAATTARPISTLLTPALTTVAFATLYVVSAALGRQTLVIEGSGVSVATPAAGVAALWFLVRGPRGRWWVDGVLLLAGTWLLVRVTGSTTAQAVDLTLASAIQVGLFTWAVSRWCPQVWRAAGRRSLRRIEELWCLVGAAALSAGVSAFPAAAAAVVGGGTWSWSVALLWTVRNTVSILVLVTLGLVLSEWVAENRRQVRERRGLRIGSFQAEGVASAARTGEYLASVVLAPLLYSLWFLGFEDLPLAFPLIALTIWAGARLRTRFVVLHGAVMGVTAITFTVVGVGPFAVVGDRTTQVILAQLYVAMVVVIGLALALARDERARLVRELEVARTSAEDQALTLTAIVDTLSEGLSVVDADGEPVLRNPAAEVLLGAGTAAEDRVGRSGFYGLRHLDGSILTEDQLPSRLAMTGQVVRDRDLLVRHTGEGQARVLRFSSTPLPQQRGAVTVMRDVTAEHQERERAAHVQASLLPTRAIDVPGFDVAAGFVPASTVGGDFYDWHVAEGRIELTVADVMGKGMGAAILAAACRTALRSVSGAAVGEALSAAEGSLRDELERTGAFVTAFRAQVDVTSGAITYADAGHGLSLVVSPEGGVRRLQALGLPLGLETDVERGSAAAELRPGDLMVTFSDGVLDDDLTVLAVRRAG